MIVMLVGTQTARCAETGAATAADGLRPLLERAAELDLADRVGWQQLRAEACATIDALIAARAVPDHLAVRVGEPAVVVRRTIAAVYRHVAASGS